MESARDHGEVGGGDVLLRSTEGVAPGQAPELTFPEAEHATGIEDRTHVRGALSPKGHLGWWPFTDRGVVPLRLVKSDAPLTLP